MDALLATGREQAKGESPQLTFQKAYVLAGLAKSLDRTDDAVEFYRAAIKLRKEQNIPLYTELGNLLLRAHRYAAAVELFKGALNEKRSTAERADLLGMLARAQLLDGNLKEAIESIDEALLLEPGDLAHLFDEAWIYSHSRQWDQAITRFEKLRDMSMDKPRVVRLCQFSLSNIHVQKGDIRKGEEILEKVLIEVPDDPSVNNDLGYLYADQGKHLEKARGMIEKALKAEPDNAAYQDSMGWVLFKLGKPAEAIPFLEKAVQTPRGTDATIFDHLGDCQHALGQKDKAIENWQKALKDAKADKTPDQKLIEMIEEKLKQK